MTMTAAVPKPDFKSFNESKSITASSHKCLGSTGTELPPGTTPNKLSQPPRTPPQCFSRSSRRGILISSDKISSSSKLTSTPSTVHGSLTCPEIQNSLVPAFLGLPKPANQAPPRLRIVGATATVSTLVTVVGQPKTPALAGNGGLRRGFPGFPSILSIKEVYSSK